MPFDAGGTFTRSYNWQADRDAGIKILAQRMDGEFNNYAGGLNQTFLRTGIVPMGGPLNMNSNPIVGVAGGTLANPGFRFGNDTDSGLMSPAPGNITIVADGIDVITATSPGATVKGTLLITGAATVTGALTVAGAVELSNNVHVAGNFSATILGVDPGFYMALSSGLPLLNFDVNDYILYDRPNNSWTWAVNGVSKFGITPTSVFVIDKITVGDGFHSLSLNAGNPWYIWDTGDYFVYDRAADAVNVVIQDTTRFVVKPSLATINTNLNVVNDIYTTSGYVGTGQPAYGNVKLNNGGSLNSGYVAFHRQSDQARHGYIGFAPGPAGPLGYVNDFNGGHSFTGGLVFTDGNFTSGGQIRATGGVFPKAGDDQFVIYSAGGTPIFNTDVNDNMYYDRTNDFFNFTVSGVTGARINVNGLYVPLSGPGSGLGEVGYKHHNEITFSTGAVLGLGHIDRLLYYVGGSGAVVTLPAGAPTGSEIFLINNGSDALTLAAPAGTTLYWTSGGVASAGNRFIFNQLYKHTITCFASGTAWLITGPYGIA